METKIDRAAWLNGATATCNFLAVPRVKPRRLVLLGAPGVGKGTQAELLCANLGACHLSTGDIFRAAKQSGACERTPALAAALGYMRRGDLVPDETVLALVAERVNCLRCHGLHHLLRQHARARDADKDVSSNEGIGKRATAVFGIRLRREF